MTTFIWERFTPPDIPEAQIELVKKIIKKFLLGIYISRSGGDILYRFQVSKDMQPDLISNFIAALAMFGEEKMGAIKRIIIEGLNVELSIVSKHDLICVIFFRPNMVSNYLAEEAELGLDKFAEMFAEPLKNHRTNTMIYEKRFDAVMFSLVKDYLQKMNIFPQ
jgi:hypothetical protein